MLKVFAPLLGNHYDVALAMSVDLRKFSGGRLNNAVSVHEISFHKQMYKLKYLPPFSSLPG